MRLSTSLLKVGRFSGQVSSWSPVSLHQFDSDDGGIDPFINVTQMDPTTSQSSETNNEWSDLEVDDSLASSFFVPSQDQENIATGQPPHQYPSPIIPPHKRLVKGSILRSEEMQFGAFLWPDIHDLFPEDDVTQPEVIVASAESLEPIPDLDEIRQQAQAILDEAQTHAEEESLQMLSQAQLDAEQIKEQAKQEADSLITQAQSRQEEVTQQAYSEGMSLAKQEANTLITQIQNIVEQTHLWHQQILAQSEAIVLDVIRDVAKTMFTGDISLPVDVLQKTFARSIAEAKPLGNLRIRLNPLDLEALNQLWIDQQSAFINRKIEIIPSQAVQRGGCLIEGDFGTLDATVETKFSHVMQTLNEVQQGSVVEADIIHNKNISMNQPSSTLVSGSDFHAPEIPESVLEQVTHEFTEDLPLNSESDTLQSESAFEDMVDLADLSQGDQNESSFDLDFGGQQ